MPPLALSRPRQLPRRARKALPGLAVGFGLKALQDQLIPPYTPSLRDEDALPRRRRRRAEEGDAPPRPRLKDDGGHIRRGGESDRG